jgi:hypothetical protein
MKAVRLLVALIALAILLTPNMSTAAPSADGPPDRRFGAIETYDAPAAASELGAGWTRVPFLWAQMQPNGTHEWFAPISDEALALEISQGRQPVGLVITTPAWATDTSIGPGVPYGLHLGHDDPNNLWANYLRQLVGAYAGRIDHWIIWNEPDVWQAEHPGYTWGGSVNDFLQLQRVAYLTIKQTNPAASVIFSGTSYWWDAAYGRDLYFRRYLDALVQDLGAAGNNYYCDAVALHVYFQPDFVYSITALYHQLMREHGFDKPVWLVETNAAPSLDPQMPAPGGLFAITLDEQAAYIIQSFAMGIAGGASRISVFKMIDTSSDLAANPEPFGLVRADGSRRPAFTAYRVAATYLAGFQGGQLQQRDDANIVTVPRAGGTTTVVWTRTPAPVTLQVPAHAASATLVDMWGNRRSISASDGTYTLQLPGAVCTHVSPCIIGGAPLMIVEGAVDAVPPPAAASSASAPTQTPTLAPAYAVSLQPDEIEAARDVWRERALPGYQLDLVAGPPFYRYLLTIVNEQVTRARRSLVPLADAQDDSLTPMRTIFNRQELAHLTIEGLFDQVERYYQDHPACDTQVTVKLDGAWAFPRRIVERWDEACETEGEPTRLEVLAFATLTSTPSPTPPPTFTPAATATALPTATEPPPTPTATQSPSATPTPTPATTTPGVSPVLGVALLAIGAIIFSTFVMLKRKA